MERPVAVIEGLGVNELMKFMLIKASLVEKEVHRVGRSDQVVHLFPLLVPKNEYNSGKYMEGHSQPVNNETVTKRFQHFLELVNSFIDRQPGSKRPNSIPFGQFLILLTNLILNHFITVTSNE